MSRDDDIRERAAAVIVARRQIPNPANDSYFWRALDRLEAALEAETPDNGLCGDPDPKHPGRSCTIATGHGGTRHGNDHYEWESA